MLLCSICKLDGFTFGTSMFKIQLLKLISTNHFEILHTSACGSDKCVGKVSYWSVQPRTRNTIENLTFQFTILQSPTALLIIIILVIRCQFRCLISKSTNPLPPPQKKKFPFFRASPLKKFYPPTTMRKVTILQRRKNWENFVFYVPWRGVGFGERYNVTIKRKFFLSITIRNSKVELVD